MTRVSKDGNPHSVKRYFVEEKLIALPISIVALASLSLSGLGTQAGELSWGFIAVWSDPVLWPLLGAAVTLTIVSVFAAIILLDPRENSYCVPLERSSSLLAGLVAAYLLHWLWGLPAPTTPEVIGATVLMLAITLLCVAPRFEVKRSLVQSIGIQHQ